MNMTDANENARSQDDIDFKNQIGKGSYGEVWRARWNGQDVAAKILHPEFFNADYGQEIKDHYISEFRKEWEVLRELNHPNIVNMYTVLFPPNVSPVIVMELMPCDLLHYIEKYAISPKVSPSKWLSIALGVAEGLEYLHGRNPPVVHRDIATKNILLTVNGHPKIADLGVAKVFAAGKDAPATVGPGTPVYAAPETYLDTVKDKAKYGVKVDIFSFGVTLLAIVIGHEPVVFPKKINAADGSRIFEIERRETDIKQIKGHRLEKMIIDCLQDDSSKRPHAYEIVNQMKKIKQNTIETKIGQLARCNPNTEFMKVPSQPSYNNVFKVIFLGNSGVGKSCLTNLLKDPRYKIKDQVSTIGVDFERFSFKFNSWYVQIDVTDTGGQERFHSIPPNYIRNSDGVFLVYDVSEKKSFELLPYWLEMIEWYAPESCKILLVGNKVDLREPTSDTQLDSQHKTLTVQENALIFASNFGLPYMETSSTNIDSIHNMMQYMVEMLMTTVPARLEDIRVDDGQNPSGSRSSFPPEQNRKKICPWCSII